MQPSYSPLCDSDPVLYNRYLLTVILCGNGTEFVRVDEGGIARKLGERMQEKLGDVERTVREGGTVEIDGVWKIADEFVESDKQRGRYESPFVAFGETGRVFGSSEDSSIVDEHGGKVHGSFCKESGIRKGVVVGPNGGASFGRGPNYERNAMNRLRKKQNRLTGKSGNKNSRVFVSALSNGNGFGCTDEVRAQLNESKAKAYIAENNLRAAQAEAKLNRHHMVQKSRVYETKFECDRQVLEDKLRMLSEKRLGVKSGSISSCGSTKLSSDLSGAPSTGCCSMSPESSASIKDFCDMKREIERLEKEIVALTTKSSDPFLKEVQILRKKVQGYERKVAGLELKNKTLQEEHDLNTKGYHDPGEYADCEEFYY